ncbi:MAG: acyloxyacyl hydrolase [Gammaproteobacteria bacterium]|nr:acyloxyacyl hydrolase [Gammaproteobacteria bacterium]
MKSSKSKLIAALVLFPLAFQAVWADEGSSLSLGPFEVLPGGKGRVMVGLGEFNAFNQRTPKGDGPSAMANLEYRFGKKISYLGFALGGLMNTNSGSFVYVGNYVDIGYKNYVITPLLSVGSYRKGAGPDLGGTLQFRSSITLAYELEDGSRVGVRVAHISNAGIHDENPGANEFLVTYGFPF